MIITPSPQQRQAIEAPLGAVLVVAGPGAGKTFCLIGRVNHLISVEKFSPERICAVTFTNRAAEEITTRLRDTLGPRAEDITRGTLHSLCVAILREHGELLGLRRGFGIADENYQRLVLRHLEVRRKRWNQLLTLFGRRRLQGYDLTAGDEALYLRYISQLRSRNILDFDDIIACTAELFEKQRDVARQVGARWDYVLVDEFQDLNPAQYAILRRLVEPQNNFFGVGDDEQSIFSWTGADPEVLKRFERDFGITHPIVLDRNRRCSHQIFETARRLLHENPKLFDKQLRTERASAFDVAAFAFEHENAESTWILSDLIADQASTGHSWGDYAILYRQHKLGYELEKCFVRAGIPCRLARGRALQDDPVIAYVVTSLRVVSRPDDPLAIEAFAERMLPEELLERVRTVAAAGGDFLDSLRTHARGLPKSHPDRRKAWRFVYHVENLNALYQSHDTLAGLVEELLAQRVGKYRNVLEERHDELSDPAAHPAVVQLADRLRAATVPGCRVWIEPARGLEIALLGMLRGAGFPDIEYLSADAAPADADVILREGDQPATRLPLLLFKALQLVQSGDFREVFQSYVAFDLETTDKDANACEIVEIGAAKVRDGEIVDRFGTLVRANRPISVGAQKLHGYTDDDIQDAPLFEEVWPKFREFVRGHTLIAHNGQRFDVPVLRRAARGLEGVDELVFFDTLPLARSLYRESARLPDLASRFGLDAGRSHHAEDDAVTLAKVFGELSRQKIVRARKAALVNLLDYLGLALALAPEGDLTEEEALLLELARPFTLGRYSDCLDFYATERERVGATDAPSVEQVIDRLGGAAVMDRIRAERAPAQRYPTAVARLQALIEASRADSVDQSIQRFLELVVLSTSEGAEADPHRVNLLTLHSTKGLEFSRVYVVGVEDDQIPGSQALKENDVKQIEEARRLLYVGMTRAEDRLVLTHVQRRFGRDAGGDRFLREMGIEARPPSGPSPPSPAMEGDGLLHASPPGDSGR